MGRGGDRRRGGYGASRCHRRRQLQRLGLISQRESRGRDDRGVDDRDQRHDAATVRCMSSHPALVGNLGETRVDHKRHDKLDAMDGEFAHGDLSSKRLLNEM